MSTSPPLPTTVVLVDLPGFYKGMLEEQFRRMHLHPHFIVDQLTDSDSRAPQLADDAVIVVAATATALRKATRALGHTNVLGTLAVTDESPKGDVYLVAPAGTNVSDQRLAELIRDLAVSAYRSPTRSMEARLTRSDS